MPVVLALCGLTPKQAAEYPANYLSDIVATAGLVIAALRATAEQAWRISRRMPGLAPSHCFVGSCRLGRDGDRNSEAQNRQPGRPDSHFLPLLRVLFQTGKISDQQ